MSELQFSLVFLSRLLLSESQIYGITQIPLQELHFVGETGVARPTGIFRDVIRSQARSSRPNRRKGSEPRIRRLHDLRSKADSGSDWEAEASNMLILESTQDLSPRNSFASLDCSPRSNTLNPFDSMCIGTDNGNTRFLLHHCK